jgi:hypothetical protein
MEQWPVSIVLQKRYLAYVYVVLMYFIQITVRNANTTRTFREMQSIIQKDSGNSVWLREGPRNK